MHIVVCAEEAVQIAVTDGTGLQSQEVAETVGILPRLALRCDADRSALQRLSNELTIVDGL